MIRAFDPVGTIPGLVRVGFVLCGAVATVALAKCASMLADDGRAGAVAALAFSLAPLLSVSFAAATPDGPFVACWCLALWLAVRAERFGRPLDFALLGVALGGALLARLFGVVLIAGIAAYALYPTRRWLWSHGLATSFLVALAVFAPFLVWNAAHEWVSFSFALVHRHEEPAAFSPGRVVTLLLTQAAAYSPGIWLVAMLCALRPRSALLAWSALPLFVFLLLFALFRHVEVYWVLGPFASLCGLAGIAYVAASERARAAWPWVAIAPAALLLPLVFLMTFAPGTAYRIVAEHTRFRLRNTGPFEIFAFAPLAKDAARLSRERDTIVMTDGYGLSSVLDFDAGVYPVVIGYDWQGRESHAWYPSTMRPTRALFVDKEPLATRRDFQLRLARACGRVTDGGIHAYAYGSAPARRFYFTWCDGMRPDGLAILRWETPS